MKISNLSVYRLRVSLALCLLSIVFASEIFAQNRSTISGHIFGPGRSPLGQVAVELRNDFNSVIGRTRTNGSGQFVFFGVPNGRFTITALPLGTNFDEQSQSIEIAGTGARGQPLSENAQVDFYLKPRKGFEAAADNEVLFAQEVPDAAKKIYENAIADLDSKRTSQGLAGLKRAIEIFPTYFLALQRLGAEQLQQEEYADATGSFQAALSVNQRCFPCWHGLTFANFTLKNWNGVIESAGKVLELDKSSISTLTMLGISQRSLQRYEESERSLLKAKKIDAGKTPEIYWNLALLYAYNLKKYQEAADALELYLKANPDIPDTTNIKKVIKRLRENRPPTD
ncbi:MAG: carboxypeptidase regulatory-like domain-containing protein [Acidobacteriota bacterium]